MTTPDDTALDLLRDRVENLERAADENATDNVYARCYGILATALFLLSFLPYSTTDDGWRDNAWEGPGGGHTGATLNTFAMLFLLPLLFTLLCATVRPGKSPWVGWVIGALALGVGVFTWALTLNLAYPSWATTALIVVSFVCAVTGFIHGTHRLRIRDRALLTDL
ncbi:hypothetical protein ACFQ1S_24160 [Kibdelosporangium lantanae]|uniref:Uncharacterized protein n=1 Tax=Kibdelosporangium lantanae TaxID=1497396 RepID=A0ABW3MEC0_9PSEU